MADDIKIGLDGGPLQEAAKPAISALKEFRELIDQLDKRSLKGLARESQSLFQQLKAAGRELSSSTETLVTGMASAIDRATAKAAPKAKTAGKQLGRYLASEIEEEVAKAKVRVSAPRMVLPSGLGVSVGGAGIGSADAVMSETRKLMAEAGARTTAQLAEEAKTRVEMLKMEADSSRLTFAARRSAYRWEQAELKKAATQEQQDANTTFRFRQNWHKAEQAELKKATLQEQKDSNTNFRFRQSWYKAEQAELKKAALQEQRDSNLTFQLRQRWQRSEQREALAFERSRLTGIDRNASFAAMGQAGQLSRATRVAAAMGMGMSDGEAIARYGSAAVAASRNIDQLRASTTSLTQSSKTLATGQREVHSAIRGVAGAAGALFLTYGSLIPLMTTFFATAQVRDAIKAYKDLEYQIRFVQALEEGGMGMAEDRVRNSLSASAMNAGYDPVEAAKGMRLLAQSGLDAKQALQSLPSVLMTATVGELGVAHATETLTGAVHAFGLEISDMERVGDVLAKAGAMSNTSVDRMAESLRQASTVAQQYHMNIEDVSTALTLLAKRNIVGSAAGTSLTNMMRDLSNPHGRAKKAANEIGFNAFDAEAGTTKNLFDQILPELREKLSKYTLESQKRLIADLTNNRGEKLLSALLGATDRDLQEIRAKLNESEGFVREANERIMDSVEGDMKRLRAAYTTTLANAGSAGSGDLRTALQELRSLVSSPEFQGLLTNLLKLAGGLAKAFVFLGQSMMNPIVQFGATAAAAGTMSGVLGPLRSMLSGTSLGLAGVGASAGGAAAGAASASRAMTLLRGASVTLLRVFGGFAVLTTVISLLGALYDKMQERNGTDAAIQAAKDYNANLRATNDQLREQIRLKSELEGTQALEDTPSGVSLKAAQAELEAARAARDAGPALATATTGGGAAMAYRVNRSRVSRLLDDRVSKAEEAVWQAMDEVNKTAAERAAKTTLLADLRGSAQEVKPLVIPTTGPKDYVPDDKPDAGARREAQADYRNALKEINLLIAGNQKLVRATDESSKHELAMLEQRYDRGLLNFKDYQTSMTAIQEDQEAVRINLAESARSAVAESLAELRAKAAIMKAKGGAGAIDQLENDIQQLAQKLNEADEELNKLSNAQTLRREKLETEGLKPAADILRNAEKSDALEDERIRRETEKLMLKGRGIEMSERDLFVQEQVDRVLGQQLKGLVEIDTLLQKLAKEGKFDSPDGAALKKLLEEYRAGRQTALSGARDQITGAAGAAFDGARLDGLAEKLSGTAGASLKEAVTAGLTGDTTALQNFGETLKKTVVSSLVDALYEAFVADQVKSAAKGLVGLLKGGGGDPLGDFLQQKGLVDTVAKGASSAGGLWTSFKGLFGFADGGYTGPGARLQPAGVVHAGEYVINAASTRKLGLGFLDSLNEFADGGYVPQTYGPSMPSSPAARVAPAAGPTIVLNSSPTINVDSRSDRAAVIADVQRVVGESQRQYTEQLKRAKVLPQ